MALCDKNNKCIILKSVIQFFLFFNLVTIATGASIIYVNFELTYVFQSFVNWYYNI